MGVDVVRDISMAINHLEGFDVVSTLQSAMEEIEELREQLEAATDRIKELENE